MNQNDYIILRDENGKAYIAHAGLLDNARNAIRGAANSISTTAQQVASKAKSVGRGVRQNHKYILKVLENGKTRYFYKQEEVKAYYEAKRKGIKNPAEYAQKVADAASNAVDAVKNAVNKAGNAAKATAQNAINKAKDIAGYDERERANQAEQNYQTAANNVKKARGEMRTAYQAAEQYANKLGDRQYDESKLTSREKANIRNLKGQMTEAEERYNTAVRKSSVASRQEGEARTAYEKTALAKAENMKEAASSAFSKAKDATNNTVNNAKNAYERMKSEFKNKAQKTAQAAVDATINKAAYEAPRAAAKVKEAASDLMDTAKRKTGITAKEDVEKAERELTQAKRDSAKTEQVRREVTKNGESDSSGNKWYKTEQEARRAGDAEFAAERARNEVINKENSLKNARSRYEDTPLGKAQDMIDKAKASIKETKSNAQDMIDRARVVVKDKSEDLSAKAKSTAQSAKDSVQGMIDNARSSTAKAVNEAWDKIPKNTDGTVNIFDKNFQSTYNDWKSKKDKYDSSLAGRAKDAAEKATDSVQDMIDKAKKAVKSNSGSTNARATKSSYGEYSDNDKDFAEENYSDKNHVEDTDFYTFKRPDGQWVILEEDMKWVLPKGVTGNDPGVRNALKQFADHASSAKAIGNENYNTDQWVDAVTDAIDKAAEKQRKR